jgi:hypothetical protein
MKASDPWPATEGASLACTSARGCPERRQVVSTISSSLSRFSVPIDLQASTQGHARTMQHYPEVRFRNVEHTADPFAVEVVDFAQIENGGDIFGKLA